MPWDQPVDDEHCEHVATTAGHIRALLKQLRGDDQQPEENTNERHE